MTPEDAREAVKKYGNKTMAAQALGIPLTTFRRAFDSKQQGGVRAELKAAKTTKGNVKIKTLQEFRNEYDKSVVVPKKINAALKLMGRHGWVYEVEFARLAGLSMTDISAYRDMFADHVVTLRERRAWAGCPETALEMKENL
jgi:hypothetical protein